LFDHVQLYRPADPIETAAAYSVAIESRKTPTCLALTRQTTTILENGSYEGAKKGGYVLSCNQPNGKPDIILMASGSEVSLVVDAAVEIRKTGKTVRVVSFPCLDRFEKQSDEYKDSVLPSSVPRSQRLACEAASSYSWPRYADNFVCIDDFGVSGPGNAKMYELFGMTVDNIVSKCKDL
jgi:transketolase